MSVYGCHAPLEMFKGQLISKFSFGVFKSPKRTKDLATDKNFIGFLWDLKTPKGHFEIKWPSETTFLAGITGLYEPLMRYQVQVQFWFFEIIEAAFHDSKYLNI